jgi:outer membrane protein, heavy metal efflux system
MQQREAAQLQAALRALLNRPLTSPEIVAEPLRPRAGDPVGADLVTRNPELRIQHARIGKADLDVRVAEREKKPDFGLQYMWQHTASNFRDYYMATFSIRLPNRRRVNATIGEAEARRQQIEAAQTAQHRQLQGELEQELAMLRTIRDQLRIYREGLTPQSEAAFNTGMAAYRTGKQEYQALLASYSDTLRLGIEYQQLIAEHESTIARIERLTGGEVK